MKKSIRNLVLVLAFAFIATLGMGAVKAKAAASFTYDPSADTITASEATNVILLKKSDGVNLKATADFISLSASTAVSLTELGAKSTTKDVYIFDAGATIDEKGYTAAKPSFTIKAQASKKIVGVIDYTQIDNENSVAVLTATATANTEAKTVSTLAIDKLQWSEDGTAWADPADATAGITGKKLAGWLAEGKTIYIREKGTAAIRTSKAVKVKIAKQAKAPKMKIDVKKNTISLKNGFDFALNTATDEAPVAGTWYTILPVLSGKTTAKEAGTIFATTSFKPLDKKATGADVAYVEDGKVSFTKTKVKALTLDDMYAKLSVDFTADRKIAVRKSATVKKPSSAVTAFTIKAKAGNPFISTVSNTAADSVIAEDAKGAFKAPALWPNATFTGFTDTIKTNVISDTATQAYEYAVVAIEDLVEGTDKKIIDWSTLSWKKIKQGTKITLKTNSKYCVVGSTTKKTVVFSKEFAISEEVAAGTIGADVTGTVLIIRRAGVKASAIGDTVIPSGYLITALKKATGADGKATYQWITSKPIGEAAPKYTIKFAIYDEKATGADKFVVDTEKTVVGYNKEGEEVDVTLPTGLEVVGTPTTTTTGTGASYDSVTKKLTIGSAETTLTIKMAAPSKITVKVMKKAKGATEYTEDTTASTTATTAIAATKYVPTLASAYTIPTIEGYEINQSESTTKNAILTFADSAYKITTTKAEETLTLYFDEKVVED